MNRLRFPIMIMLLVCCLVSPFTTSADGATTDTPAAASETQVVALSRTVVANAWLGLRVRSGPSLTESSGMILRNGDEVQVIGDPVWNQGIRWVQVATTADDGDAISGWVASAYLADYPGYDEPYDGYIGTEGYKVNATSGLRLRQGPGLSYVTIRIVPYGAILERTEASPVASDGYVWYGLNVQGTEMWAASEYLTKVP